MNTTNDSAADHPVHANAAEPQWHAIAMLIASMAGLLFGFDTAVISGTTSALKAAFALNPDGLGIAVSAALWGTLAGATVSGRVAHAVGSRRLLVWVGWGYVVSAVGSASAPSLAAFWLFRALGGMAIGASSVAAPVYIAEISPPASRGRWVGLFQFNIVLGILLAYLSNALVAQQFDASIAWRIKLAIAGAPALLFALAMTFVPESPRWLATKPQAASAPSNNLSTLAWRSYWRPIMLAVALAAFNQLSGINAILYYLNDIFASAGYSAVSADTQAVAIGAANLGATLLGMAMIDWVGRRVLLIGGAIGTALALSGVTFIFVTGAGSHWLLALLVLFILSFAVSQGAVIWVYLAELFPTPVRARGQSLGCATHWAFNAAISFGFPVITSHAKALPFGIFSIAMMAQGIIVWRWFPETRGRALEELTEHLTV